MTAALSRLAEPAADAAIAGRGENLAAAHHPRPGRRSWPRRRPSNACRIRRSWPRC